MELTKQVCSLELAKKLKELGVKQKSLFYWNCLNQKPRLATHKTLALYEGDRLSLVLKVNDIYSAFTVAELGEMLKKSPFGLPYWGSAFEEWQAMPIEVADAIAPTEADARAKMLVYLLENKLITL